ncbi:MAG: hypothetical protein DI586_08540 [Micavibrio aeruginosavorus]|uniref:Uncharacterized protein n=1 Tax=Micavibrio aeruginosavorus TaxID=349221 RepID=A0A2W5HM67_9BACT|nr:MAG: hypothetical protein DI586_08540 [Micavibrio aeruginosavorus]
MNLRKEGVFTNTLSDKLTFVTLARIKVKKTGPNLKDWAGELNREVSRLGDVKDPKVRRSYMSLQWLMSINNWI